MLAAVAVAGLSGLGRGERLEGMLSRMSGWAGGAAVAGQDAGCLLRLMGFGVWNGGVGRGNLATFARDMVLMAWDVAFIAMNCPIKGRNLAKIVRDFTLEVRNLALNVENIRAGVGV